MQVGLEMMIGEAGIRTLGAQWAQRFSRPPRSTAPAPLQYRKQRNRFRKDNFSKYTLYI